MSELNDKTIQEFLSPKMNCNIMFVRIENGLVKELCIERFRHAFVVRFVQNEAPRILKPEYSIYKVGRDNRETRVAAFFQEELEDNMRNFGFREGMIEEWYQKIVENPSEKFYNSDHTFFIARTPEDKREFKNLTLP